MYALGYTALSILSLMVSEAALNKTVSIIFPWRVNRIIGTYTALSNISSGNIIFLTVF